MRTNLHSLPATLIAWSVPTNAWNGFFLSWTSFPFIVSLCFPDHWFGVKITSFSLPFTLIFHVFKLVSPPHTFYKKFFSYRWYNRYSAKQGTLCTMFVSFSFLRNSKAPLENFSKKNLALNKPVIYSGGRGAPLRNSVNLVLSCFSYRSVT